MDDLTYKVKKLLEEYPYIFGVEDLRSKINSHYQFTFINPALPFNKNCWVGCFFDGKGKKLHLHAYGTPKINLPEEFLNYVSLKTSNKGYSQIGFSYKWNNVDFK